MDVTLNSWTSIFLLAAAQGIFLSILIISKKDNRSLTSGALSLVVFLFSVILVYCVGFWTGINNHLPPFINLTLSLTYVIGPLMLFFVQTCTTSRKLKKIDLLHFIPFTLHFIAHSSVLYYYNSTDTEWLINTLIVLQNIHLTIYAVLVLKFARKAQKKWLSNIALAYGAFALCFLSYYVMSWTGILRIEYDYIVSLGMSLFIYFVGYYGYHHQIQPFYGLQKYRNSGFSDTVTRQFYNKIYDHMITKRPFLNQNLKMNDIANELSLSTHIVSQVINQYTNGSFSDFVNKFRVKEAIRLMHTDEFNNEKLISIAYDSGFGNKVSFNNAFKKITKNTPTEYRKSNCSQLK